MNKLTWKKEDNNLINEMEKWRRDYECNKNCNDWKKWKFCEHLRKSRAQKFNKEIKKQLQILISLN